MERFFLWFLPKVSIISIDTHIVEGIAFSMLWVEAYSLSVQFSCSVVSDSLWPHGLQHTRPPCPSPTPGVCSNSCPSSQWCHPTISFSVVPFSHLQSFQHQGFFKWVSSSHEVAKYWSFNFSISPSNECSGLISFRMNWLDLLAVQARHFLLMHSLCIPELV